MALSDVLLQTSSSLFLTLNDGYRVFLKFQFPWQPRHCGRDTGTWLFSSGLPFHQ